MSKKHEHKVVRIRKCFVKIPTLLNFLRSLHQSIELKKVDYERGRMEAKNVTVLEKS